MFLDEKRFGEAAVDPDHDVKLKALAWLRENGWCQRGYIRAGRGCVMTALVMASNPGMAADIAFRLKGGQSTLVDWNDAPERTFADVEALLEGK